MAERAGPFFYQWSPESPMRKAGYFNNAEDAEVLGRFARMALLAQPLDFAKVVGKDVVRFAVPDAGTDRPWSGSGPDEMSFGNTVPAQQSESREQIAAGYATVYDGVAQTMPGTGGLTVLEIYQETFRVPAILLLAGLLLSAAGERARARERAVGHAAAARHRPLPLRRIRCAELLTSSRYGVTPSAL